MFVVSLWSDQVTSRFSHNIKLYAKLGGAFLGFVDASPSKKVVGTLRSLQYQASLLVKHPTRNFRDVQLWVGDKRLTPTGFAWHDDVSLKCVKNFALLFKAKRVDMMWNEDDSIAKTHLLSYPALCVARSGTLVQVVGRVDTLPRHLLWHENTGATTWVFATRHPTSMVDLGFLEYATNVQAIVLKSLVPFDWKNCNVAELSIEDPNFVLDCSKLSGLTCLERLTLNLATTNLAALASLPWLSKLVLATWRHKLQTYKTFEGKELHEFLHSV